MQLIFLLVTAVNLGLSVLWADCNAGAEKPWQHGDLVIWEMAAESASSLGEGWRLPDSREQDELREKCNWEWTETEGGCGYRVTGPSGNSIFLPASGYRYKWSLSGRWQMGYYWSSSSEPRHPEYYIFLVFGRSACYRTYTIPSEGMSVRAVRNQSISR